MASKNNQTPIQIVGSCLDILRPLYISEQGDQEKLDLSRAIDQLMRLQEMVMHLETELLETQTKIKGQEEWEKAKMQYEPFRLFSGTTVMLPKESKGSPYLAEWCCKNCFDNKKKSQLQPDPVASRAYFCPACTIVYSISMRDEDSLKATRR